MKEIWWCGKHGAYLQDSKAYGTWQIFLHISYFDLLFTWMFLHFFIMGSTLLVHVFPSACKICPFAPHTQWFKNNKFILTKHPPNTNCLQNKMFSLTPHPHTQSAFKITSLVSQNSTPCYVASLRFVNRIYMHYSTSSFVLNDRNPEFIIRARKDQFYVGVNTKGVISSSLIQ
jgi:hypothetical protein